MHRPIIRRQQSFLRVRFIRGPTLWLQEVLPVEVPRQYPRLLVNQTLTNPTSTVQTATYTVTPIGPACTGATFQLVVTVNPKPLVPNQATTICSGISPNYAPANNPPATIVPAGTLYTWTNPVVTGGITGGSAQAIPQTSVNQTLTNPTTTAQTATYTVTPVGPACTGATFQLVVTVNPKPLVPNQATTICSGTSPNYAPANNPPVTIIPVGTLYTWTNPVVTGGITGGSAQAIPQTSVNQTLTNPTSTAQTATYTVTPIGPNCTGATFQLVVTVNPTTVVPNQVTTICSGTSPNYAPANNPPATIVPAGTLYTWTNPVVTGGITGGSAQAVPQTSVNQTLTNPTSTVQTATYTVTPIGPNCTGATFQLVVTVNPKPLVPNQATTICSGISPNYAPANNPPATIVPAGTLYTWTNPVVTGGITGGSAQAVPQTSVNQTLINPTNVVQTATYTVTPVGLACTGATFQLVVTVNPKPLVPNQATTICSGISPNYAPANNPPATIVPAGTLYTWTNPVVTGGITGGSAQAVPQTSVNQTLTNPTSTVQTATYTVTPVRPACTGATFQLVVTVNPKPLVPNQATTICSGTSPNYAPANNPPATIVPAGTLYTWTNPVVTGGITGGSAQAVPQASGQPDPDQPDEHCANGNLYSNT